MRSLLGAAAVFVLLAALASVPGLAFLALGVMLELEARLARGTRFRAALPWVGIAPRIVGAAIAVWLWLIPLRLLGSAIGDARVIDPQSSGTATLLAIRAVLAPAIAIHVSIAVLRGARLRCFLRPIDNARWLIRARRGPSPLWGELSEVLRSAKAELAVWHHLSLGLRGFAGAFVWLVVPTACLAAGEGGGAGGRVAAWAGGIAMVPVLAWLPFLQARLAAEDRLGAIRELSSARAISARAPLARLLALVVSYGLTLPLYLGMIVLPPQDAAWLIAPIFIAAVIPGRVAVGWAYARGARRAEPVSPWVRWVSRVLLALLLAIYVFMLFATQFIGARGTAVLFTYPAFLLPLPRLG